jgi:hypothetical protein
LPRVKLSAALNTFTNELNQNLNLATDAVNFKESRGGKYQPILKARVNLIVELSFSRYLFHGKNF